MSIFPSNPTGKVVFITGASSGIGAYIAREFASRQAIVVLFARRIDRIQSLANELKSNGEKALAVSGDVTNRQSLESALQQAKKEFGHIDIVIANAGFGVTGQFEKLNIDDYRRQFETNVFGVLNTVSASLDALKASRGHLAVLGSIAGHLPLPGGTPYCMSKFAIRAYTLGLRYELARYGIQVTLISPGFVDSEIRQVDNQGKWHTRPSRGVPSFLMMPTHKAARQITCAILRGKEEAIITLHGKIMVFLYRHFPWIMSLVLATQRVR